MSGSLLMHRQQLDVFSLAVQQSLAACEDIRTK